MRVLRAKIVYEVIKHFRATTNPEWSIRDSLTHVLEYYDTGYNLTSQEYGSLLQECQANVSQFVE